MRALLASLLLLAPTLSWSAGAWAPKMPPPRLHASAGAPPVEAVPVESGVILQGLGVLAQRDTRGLGEEARRAAVWAQGTRVSMKETAFGYALVSSAGAFPISEELGTALGNMRGYFGMTAETLSRPVTFEELKAAVLSDQGVAAIRFLFETMIETRLPLANKVLVPEIGGELTLDEGLEFHLIADPVRPMFRRLAAAIDDAEALQALYDEDPELMGLIDEYGLLKGFLSRLPRYKDNPRLTPEKVLSLQRMTVTTLLENSADTYVMEPASQVDAIISQQWSGRYLGWWHTHPPNYTARGWTESGPPSGPDMEIARKRGQNLTIAFRPDGFTAYDLSPLGEDPEAGYKAIRAVEYRSPEWKAHFQALHDAIIP